MRKTLSEQIPSHTFVIFPHGNTIMVVMSKKSKTRTKPVYPSLWDQPWGKSDWDYCVLERIASSKAYLQAESNTEWMDGPKRTQANIYDSVTVDFRRTKFYLRVFLFPFDVTFMYVQLLMNARKIRARLNNEVSTEVDWQLKLSVAWPRSFLPELPVGYPSHLQFILAHTRVWVRDGTISSTCQCVTEHFYQEHYK